MRGRAITPRGVFPPSGRNEIGVCALRLLKVLPCPAPTLLQQRPVWVCGCGYTSVQGLWSWAGVATHHQEKTQRDRGEEEGRKGGATSLDCPLRLEPQAAARHTNASNGVSGLDAAARVCVLARHAQGKITQESLRKERKHKQQREAKEIEKSIPRLVRFAFFRALTPHAFFPHFL